MLAPDGDLISALRWKKSLFTVAHIQLVNAVRLVVVAPTSSQNRLGRDIERSLRAGRHIVVV